MDDPRASLKVLSKTVDYRVTTPALWDACYSVLDNDSFQVAPASAKHHHVYDGGLMVHTREVLLYAFTAAEPLCIDLEVLITACIFHDFGKIYDYERSADGVWVEAPYRKLVRHVSGSHAYFVSQVAGKIPLTLQHQIEHCILAHHGRQEWGSPVEPQTIEALLLHQADMVSAQYGAGKEKKL